MCSSSLKYAQWLRAHPFHVNLAVPCSVLQSASSRVLSSLPVGFCMDTSCPQLCGDPCACDESQQPPAPHFYSIWGPSPLLSLSEPLPHTPRSRIAPLTAYSTSLSTPCKLYPRAFIPALPALLRAVPGAPVSYTSMATLGTLRLSNLCCHWIFA